MQIPNAVKQMVTPDQIIIVATADDHGTPHLAAAKGMILIGDEQVAFKNWFCLQTLQNVSENPKIALSLFGPTGEHGYQLLGTVKQTRPAEIMDGDAPGEIPSAKGIPQAKMQLVVAVTKVLEFSTGPHSDEMHIPPEAS